MPKGITSFGKYTEKTFQSIDINNRKELQQIADEERIYINWTLWDELVEKTKQDITNLLEEYSKPLKHKNGKPLNTVYVYNLDGQFINTFKSPQHAAEFFDISPIVLNQCIRNNMPYYKEKLFFTKEPINQ